MKYLGDNSMRVKAIIKWVLLIALPTLSLPIIGFVVLYFWLSHDPYGRLFDSQDLPPSAINGDWLAMLTPHPTNRFGVERLAERGIVVRVRVLDESYDTLSHIVGDYFMFHLFSIYQAEVLEIYVNHLDFGIFTPDVGGTLEFSQIKRIVGRCRENWFEAVSPPTNIFPPVRLPISEGDELVLFLSGLSSSRSVINPINGVYRYAPEQNTEGNRVFESLNEHCGLVLTEM